ncbi:MAG: glutamine-hydrolyzing GMP synthase [Candidatus Diapherotrites archaeon]|uniref:GMP synthase (glutamine-hydrolyzing) n=1 Tax=Candidatus Iainarchaeum sp. TaxID=3101447 RepID=A0A2D6M154_9ARCH|nr:glutamine-hydrolyzing GMP synthase [Candidatus Diapherotrites archaeon]|tara:strand:- start:5543 stop:7342 length:1800 start_codon:yes stop_codon:yes gene_type:complete
MEENKIIVLDFGAQYGHLIARRVRQLHVFSEILEPTAPLEELKKAKGIILSGGPSSVYDKDAPAFNPEIFSLGKPILGLCYGHQLMAQQLGGKVEKGNVREFGTAELEIKNKEGLLADLGEKETVWMSHGDKVESLPQGFEVIGSTADCEAAAVADFSRNYFGLQFHPEVTHTPNGLKILENFVLGVCGCKQDWTIENYIEQKCEDVRKQVGKRNVFLLASGGVDSTVALALLDKALGAKRVYALHVDTGFMRKDESSAVEKALKDLGYNNFHVVNAEKEFFEAVKGLVEPEEKRKAIGEKFIEIQNRELRKLNMKPEDWLLGQGTIYPDTIETAGTKNAARIKTHHNRVDSIKNLIEAGLVVEPLDQLYKDEVRELGEQLGLPKEMVWRHPFPGPGLAIRCLCSDGKQDDLSAIDEKANVIAKEFGLEAKVLPVKSVGVQGDARTYAHPCALIGKANWETLEKASTRITNEIREINRVIWLLAPENIDSIELIATDLNASRIEVLREADAIAMNETQENGMMKEIWQFPTVMMPLHVNEKGESIVLRPVESLEAMTARFYPMKYEVLQKIVKKIMALESVSSIFYDVTHKPPATIEWE